MAQDAELKLKLQEHGQTPTPGKIVAELGFGADVPLSSFSASAFTKGSVRRP
jgi:hypothetical protein